jgi:hypothetical protein
MDLAISKFAIENRMKQNCDRRFVTSLLMAVLVDHRLEKKLADIYNHVSYLARMELKGTVYVVSAKETPISD